jgi:hypothetical protein
MKIRTYYYIYFWLINTLTAFGTGIIMGYVAFLVFSSMFKVEYDGIVINTFIIFIMPICFILVSQFFLLSFFWGKRRGEFEYAFLEKSAKSEKPSSDLRSRLKEIDQEFRYCDDKLAYSKLKETTKMYPDNFVVQFKYAMSCERIGLAETALAAYKTSLKLIPESFNALNIYVNNQINRVKTKCPSKFDAMPGLKYLLR